MIRSGLSGVASFMGLLILSLTLPCWAWMRFKTAESQPTEHGLSWLTMPIGWLLSKGPFEGWVILYSVDDPVRENTRPEASIGAAVQLRNDLDLQYGGMLQVKGKHVYWFYDRTNNRWLEMIPGDLDTLTGLKLVRVEDPGRIFFRHASNGQSYEIRIGL